MSDGLLARLGWHAAFWTAAASGLAILRTRFGRSWDERTRDATAADGIVRHFECSWDEAVLLRRSLMQDLHRRVDALFPVEQVTLEIESLARESGQAMPRKLALWEELKTEIVSRMLTGIYSIEILTEFIFVAMAVVGKALYLRSILREHSSVTADDLSAANRLLIQLGPQFVQHGTLLLAESVRNAVRAVFGKVALQEPMTPILLDSLVSQVRHEVETACGKSVLDDCLFGRLEALIQADLTATRRRMLIAMVTETRRRMKDEQHRRALFAQIKCDLQSFYDHALGETERPPALATILPKITKRYHMIFSAPPMATMRQFSAATFVDADSDVREGLLHL